MRYATQRGFTLIELMIVVAIIGILASVALPTYQSYTRRAKLTEVLLAATSCRTLISEVYLTGTQATIAPNAWGCEATSISPSKYVSSIATDANGRIVVKAQRIGGAIDGTDLTLVPADSAGAPMTYTGVSQKVNRWICGSSAQGTTVPDKYLPGSCRG